MMSALTLTSMISSSGTAHAEAVPYVPPTEVDLLLVIDNSSSMAAMQEQLTASLEFLASEIDSRRSNRFEAYSFHIGMITTDMGAGDTGVCGAGEGGRLQAMPRGDCSGPTDAFVLDEYDGYGSYQINYEGTLLEVLQCIAPVSSTGCDYTQPFAAIKAALDGTHDTNDGFLRDNAVLAILVFTNGDDCSARNPAVFEPAPAQDDGGVSPASPDTFVCFEHGVVCDQEITREAGPYSGCGPRVNSPYITDPRDLVSFLETLEFERDRIVFGVVSGPAEPVIVSLDDSGDPLLEPTCSDGALTAEPSPRLHWVAEQFPNRSLVRTVCGADYEEVYSELDGLLNDAVNRVNLPSPGPGGTPDGGGAGVDAGSADILPDAGGEGGGSSSGCGCSGARTPGHTAGTGLLGLLILIALGRRRGRAR